MQVVQQLFAGEGLTGVTGNKTDEKGFVKEANLIVGTTNNNAAISRSIRKAAEGLIRRGADVTDGVLNRIEMAFRAYDP